MKANYRNVNNTWPDQMAVPSGQEAIAGVKRLVSWAYRFARQEHNWPKSAAKVHRYKYVLTSGNRYTEVRNGAWHVNPSGQFMGGWRDIVHHVSHWADRKFFGNGGHGPRHAYIERQMAEYVVKQGWLDGKLKSKAAAKPKPDAKLVRHQRVLARIAAWEAKQRRATTALKKLRKQQKYYAKLDKSSASPML